MVVWSPWQPPSGGGTGNSGNPGNGGSTDDSISGDSGSAMETEAASFASQHIYADQLDLNNPDQRAWHNAVHNIISRAYLAAKYGATMDGPGAYNLSAAQFLQKLENTTFTMVPSGAQNPAQTNFNPSGSHADILVSVAQVMTYEDDFGSRAAGMDYVVAHEMGHAFGWDFWKSNGYLATSPTLEAFANTMGLGIAEAMGIPYPSTSQLQGQNYGGTLPR